MDAVNQINNIILPFYNNIRRFYFSSSYKEKMIFTSACLLQILRNNKNCEIFVVAGEKRSSVQSIGRCYLRKCIWVETESQEELIQ
jgi:hypothetical protein